MSTLVSRELLLRRLAQNPFVTLNAERIRTRAYFHAENRTGVAWWVPEANWLQAELEEIELAASEGLVLVGGGSALEAQPFEFEANYELLVSLHHPFDGWRGKPQYLGTRTPRRCSLCKKGHPHVTFKQRAHVIPEAFGNKSIITLDECDECNGNLGRELDNDLANMFLLARAIGRVPAKKNPTAKVKVDSGHRSYIGGKPRDEPVPITFVDGDDSIKVARGGKKSFTVHASNISFRPISAIRSLVKTIWQALPADRRERFAGLRSLVLGDVKIAPATLYRASIPGYDNPNVRLVIWEKVSQRDELPSLVALLAFSNQFMIWSAPDFTKGQYLPALLPPIPKSPLPNHPVTLEQYTFKSDNKRLNSGRMSIGYKEMHLASTKEPIPVRIEASSASVGIAIETVLQMPPPPQALPKGIPYYVLEGERLAGRVQIFLSQEGLHIQLESKARGRSAADVFDTARLFLALRSGASIRVMETSTGHDVFTQNSGIIHGISIDKLKEIENLAGALTTINAAFSVDLKFPGQLSEEEHKLAWLLEMAIKFGRAEVREPRKRFEQQINRHQFENLATILANGSADIWIESHSSCELLGVRLKTGPCRLALENARFDLPVEELRALFIGENDETPKPITLVFDSVTYEFLNWLRE